MFKSKFYKFLHYKDTADSRALGIVISWRNCKIYSITWQRNSFNDKLFQI